MSTRLIEGRLVGGAAVAFAVALFVDVLLTDLPACVPTSEDFRRQVPGILR